MLYIITSTIFSQYKISSQVIFDILPNLLDISVTVIKQAKIARENMDSTPTNTVANN